MTNRPLYNFSDSKLIFFERVCLLYDQLLVSIPIAFGCASIIFLGLWGAINQTLLIAWYLGCMLVFIVRLSSFVLFKHSPHQSQLHLTLFTIGTTLTALLWALAGTVLMPPNGILQQTIVIVVIAGVTAGSVQSIQASRLASTLYVILSILPLFLWLVTKGGKHYYLLSAAVFCYMIFMLAMSKRGYDLIISTFKLRYENTAINGQLQEINKLLNEEIIKHKSNEKSLAQLAEIVNNSKDAIIGLDLNGIIQTWNKGAENLYSFSPYETIGKDLSFITPKSQLDSFNTMLDKVKSNLSFQDIEFERCDKFKKTIYVSVTISPIRNREGKIIGISTIERDISERKEIDKLKNEFISIISHELRTPLTSLKGSIDLLLDKFSEMPPEKQKKLLNIASNNCTRLITLINDIVDIEKIETGKLKFDFKRINLLNVVKTAHNQLSSFAEKLNISIVFTHMQDAFVNADEERILQVIVNLLSNAIKFSPPHSTVEIAMRKTDKTAIIAVIDHGPGIDKEFYSKIFHKFTQEDSSTSRKKGGTGLGLSICKAILEKHHSELKFITEVGKGSTFYFELGLAEIIEPTPLEQIHTVPE